MVATGTAAAIGIAGTALTALTTAATKEYANYEQLTGGIETLFKDSSDTVMGYADNAYKTAGFSANEYMETVTGFSASLLQSLEGDTEAAAEYANMAVTDMADNANKMGTAMESIQFAYQGFSRQNFTMLDNLRLGYAGTKEEMQRLLDDAEKLSGIEYDISSYADIVEAIHVIQTEIGITGTTAKEASTTISGSVASAKSAFHNLLIGVSDDSQDFDKLVDNFVESVDVAAENILPRIETSIDGGVKLFDAVAPKIMSRVPATIGRLGPTLIKSGGKIVSSLVDGITENSDEIGEGIEDIILAGTDTMLDLAPDIMEAGVDLFSSVVGAMPKVAVRVAKAMPELVGAAVKGILDGTGAVALAFADLFNPLVWSGAVDDYEEALGRIDESLQKTADSVTPFNEQITNASKNVSDLSDALSEKGRTISDIDGLLADVEAEITNIIKAEYEEQDGYRQEDLESLREYNASLSELLSEKLGIYRNQQLAELRKTQLEINSLDQQGAAERIAAAESALKESNKITEEIYSDELTRIENYYASIGETESVAYWESMSKAKENHDAMLKENQDYYNKAVGIVEENADRISGIEVEKVEGNLEKIKGAFEEADKHLNNMNDLYGDYTENQKLWLESNEKALSLYVDAIKDLDADSVNALLSIVANTKENGQEITDETARIVDGVLDTFEILPPELEESGREVLLSMISGMESKIPGLENVSKMSTQEILSTLRHGLLDGQTNFIGSEAVGDVATGFSGGLSGLSDAVRRTVSDALTSANTSDAENAAYSIGQTLSENIAYGISSRVSSIISSVESAVNSATGVANSIGNSSRSYSSTNNYNVNVSGASANAREIASEISREIQFATNRRRAVFD